MSWDRADAANGLAIEDAELCASDLFAPDGAFFPGHRWDDTEPPAIEYLVEPWLACGSAALLAGVGGSGKSILGQLLCSCAALGVPFLGYRVKQCRALYLTAEDDPKVLRIRQQAINKALGVAMHAYRDRLSLWSLKGEIGVELGLFDAERRLTPTELYHDVAAVRSRLTVLDNAAHFFAGNEIVRHDVAAFCGLLDRLAMRTNGTVVLLAHTPKSGAEYSGSTGWDAHVRQRMFLEYDEAGGDQDARILKRSKSNYARRGETVRFRWFRGAFVRDEDLPAGMKAQATADACASADNRIFLACLAERNRQGRAVSDRPCSTYAPSVFAAMAESRGIGKMRLAAALDRLFRIGRIERGLIYRDTTKRRDVVGLRETIAGAPNTPPPTPAPNAPDPLATTAPNTHPLIESASGAHRAPAPSGSGGLE